MAHASVAVSDGDVVVSASGEFDIATSQTLADALRQACEAGLNVVIDLRDATFMDGKCFGMLLDTEIDLNAAGHRLRLENAPRVVRRIAAVANREDLVS